MLIESLNSVIVLNHLLLLLAENRRNRLERVVEVVCLLLFLTPFRLFNRIINLLNFDLFSRLYYLFLRLKVFEGRLGLIKFWLTRLEILNRFSDTFSFFGLVDRLNLLVSMFLNKRGLSL